MYSTVFGVYLECTMNVPALSLHISGGYMVFIGYALWKYTVIHTALSPCVLNQVHIPGEY